MWDAGGNEQAKRAAEVGAGTQAQRRRAAVMASLVGGHTHTHRERERELQRVRCAHGKKNAGTTSGAAIARQLPPVGWWSSVKR